jgi:hypothetical protein
MAPDEQRHLQADIRDGARRAGSASARNASMAGGSGGRVGGGNESSGTYGWKASGITNITSTGDPFYSAPG